MTAKVPTILATCGGLRPSRWGDTSYGPLIRLAIDLANVSDRAPRIAHINTAGGDPRQLEGQEIYAARAVGATASHLNFFPRRNVPELRSFILEHDVVWVGGGSVSNLLAVWRLHELDVVLQEAWEKGVVLAGGSAGGICWHSEGITTSFGPAPSPSGTALNFLPWSFTPHYDSDPKRRSALHSALGTGHISGGYAVDEGVGLLYEEDRLSRVVTETPGGNAYHIVKRFDGKINETVLQADQLS